MATIKQAASEFLSHKRVAVTGVSRTPGATAATSSTSACASGATTSSQSTRTPTRSRATMPTATCARSPAASRRSSSGLGPSARMTRCASASTSGSGTSGCTAVPARGSVSDTAADYGREHGVTVIDGGCPCMFGPTADRGHKAMRFLFGMSGNVPKKV